MSLDTTLETLVADAVSGLAPAELFSLTGRAAVVTGASGGLGPWFSAGLASAGAGVMLADRPEANLDPLHGLLVEQGFEVALVRADLLDDEAPAAIVDATLERFGRLDVLVNNAGVNRRQPIDEVDPETFDWIGSINLRAPYFLAQHAARAMRERRRGSIINIGSLNNAIGLEAVSVYGAFKAGISQMTKTMAVEWASDGIRANCISPGFMLTPLSKPLWDDPQRRRWLLRRSPLRRPGYPRELIGLLLLLATDAGSFITGQTIFVDGGWLAGTTWQDPPELDVPL